MTSEVYFYFVAAAWGAGSRHNFPNKSEMHP